MSILILPKLLGWLGAVLSPRTREQFGGGRSLTWMTASEMLFSTFLAPVMMIFHSSFVLLTLSGKGIGWAAQKRDQHGLAWRPAFRSLRLHTATGLLLLLLSLQIGWIPVFWLSPIWSGLLLSVPLVVLSSRPARGWAARRFSRASGNSAIEEQMESGILTNDSGMAFFTESADGFQNAVVDPVFNSIHLSILRETHTGEAGVPVPAADFFRMDPNDISPERLIKMLESEACIQSLHHVVWRLSENDLHPVWQRTIERYTLKPIFSP
jgi:membrane glycosyltransferase